MSINRDLKNSTTSLLRSRGSIRIGICSWRVTRLLLLRIRWWVSGILWGVALGRWCWPLGVIPRSGARLLVGRVHHRLLVGRIHPWLLVCRYWCYLLWWGRVLKNIQFINYLQIKMQALTFITIQKKFIIIGGMMYKIVSRLNIQSTTTEVWKFYTMQKKIINFRKWDAIM